MDDTLDKRISDIMREVSGRYKFVLHTDLINDLSKIISKSGQEEKFLTALLNRCLTLSQLEKSDVLASKNFEQLKYLDIELYSMHIKIGKNIRILYSFKGDTVIMLLCAFHERSGKRKTDYTNYIPIAKQRINECLGGMNYE